MTSGWIVVRLIYASQQLVNSVWNAITLRDSDCLALANACGVGGRRGEIPTTSREHLTSAGSEAPIVASLHIQHAVEWMRGKAMLDRRQWASQYRTDEHEDADQHSEDLGLHGGSVSKD